MSNEASPRSNERPLPKGYAVTSTISIAGGEILVQFVGRRAEHQTNHVEERKP
jgi:hypothetical protein